MKKYPTVTEWGQYPRSGLDSVLVKKNSFIYFSGSDAGMQERNVSVPCCKALGLRGNRALARKPKTLNPKRKP